MSDYLQRHDFANDKKTDRQLIDGLRRALEKNYSRISEAARREWERKFRGADPSDACVSVRISGLALN